MADPTLQEIQQAYMQQYKNNNKASLEDAPSLKDIQDAYTQQYGSNVPKSSNILQNIMGNLLTGAEDIGKGAITAGKVGVGALGQTGRNIGDLEWKGIHGLGNLLGLSSGPAKTYDQMYGNIEQDVGLPNSPGYKRAVDITSALMGVAAPEKWAAQAAMGSVQDPNHPVIGALLGAAGLGAAKGLRKGSELLGSPLRSVLEKIHPTDKPIQAQAEQLMNSMAGARKDLKNTYETGYNTLDIAGNEPVHEKAVGYEYPFKMEDVQSDIQPLTVQNSFPKEWHEVKDEVLAKNSPVHKAFSAFEDTPTIKNADKLKSSLNKEWPKTTDKNYAEKVNLIEQGKDILRNEFISPTLARFDAENGTNLWSQYLNADKAYAKEIANFGKNNKLDVATAGQAYDPDEYKELYMVLNKAVKEGKVPLNGPVHNASKMLKNAMNEYEAKLLAAKNLTKPEKYKLGAQHLLGSTLNLGGKPLQFMGAMSRPIAQLLAQKNNYQG